MSNSGNLLARFWAGKCILVAYVIVFGLSGQLFAKTPGCPCSPCTCGSCHCGGGGGAGSKGGNHHHGNDGDHGGVGGGMSVDLGGVGRKHREADPFAADGGGSSSTPHTQEKHVATSSKKHEGKTPNDPFQNIHCTGPQAKALAQGDTTPAHD